MGNCTILSPCVSQGQSRERSEREIYIYFCAGLREFRNKHLKRLRFSLRSLNQRRINMGLTGAAKRVVLAMWYGCLRLSHAMCSQAGHYSCL